jgi:hypothetical protein
MTDTTRSDDVALNSSPEITIMQAEPVEAVSKPDL